MTHFSDNDIEQLARQGVTRDKAEAQLERFRTGFPYLKIEAPAAMGAGVLPVDEATEEACMARWDSFLADGGDVLKFVPASGAASRMFKSLFAFVNGTDDVPAPGSDVAQVVDNIKDFAFYDELCAATEKLYGKTPDELVELKRYKDLVAAIILPEGLDYGSLPKALLTFHRYPDGVRTALEEQLAEGAQTAASRGGDVKLHFTVSANHEKLFDAKIAQVLDAMQQRYGVKYNISRSQQKPSTDTLAATPDNEPFRNADGSLVFRPGGHGALIENLNDVDATVVFIKNIDNVVADKHRESTIKYKKFIGGLLLLVHDRMEYFMKALAENPAPEVIAEACEFMEKIMSTRTEVFADGHGAEERRVALLRLLDRPLRVCGVVRNEGEPGGGPYLAWSSDGTVLAPQILESTQIDLSKPENAEMMKKAAYFNPVDLVCYLRRHDGSKFNLPDYVDPATGFISEKSSGGRDLRALELPGLWNGAMSDWNTVFVEVPASTFNPVKTVNDLLRPAHR